MGNLKSEDYFNDFRYFVNVSIHLRPGGNYTLKNSRQRAVEH